MPIRHIAAALALGLLGIIAHAQEPSASFSEFDANNDGQISHDEFCSMAGESEIYAGRDRNRDDRIDENEFTAMEFDAEEFQDWDSDDDLYLDEDEFYEGSFDAFDANDDGHWDGSEWDDAGEEGFWDV